MRKVISLLIAITMLLSFIPINGAKAYAAQSTEIPEGYTPIYTAEDLDSIRNNLEGNYILMNDIDLGSWGDWTPIGEYQKPYSEFAFSGVFDGNGHSIYNIYITDTTNDDYCIGLFSTIYEATIKNLCVSGNISCSRESLCIGAVVGHATDDSLIKNCTSNVTIEYHHGDPQPEVVYTTGNSVYIGGIVGAFTNRIEISECASQGSITCLGEKTWAYVGGIIGGSNSYQKSTATITNCYNAGSLSVSTSCYRSVIGGIYGHLTQYGNIAKCYNVGSLTLNISNTLSSDDYWTGLGGIGGERVKSDVTLSDCYYLANVPRAIGLDEGMEPGENFQAQSCSESEMQHQSTYSNFDFNSIWKMGDSSYPYPVLRGVSESVVPEPEPNIPIPDAKVINGNFNYYSDISSSTESYGFEYDDSWFFENSYEYQHDLVRMSIRMAMAGMATKENNIERLYKTLSFNDIESNYPTPEENTIGYSIANKSVQKDGEEITIIAVTIRGGGYQKEWAGNFMIGSGDTHAGFNYAASKVVTGLEDYIEEHKDNFAPVVKVWVTGYSRAAATANLVAKRLDDGQVQGISSNNVFAFCFECPQNTRLKERNDDIYQNIVNVVNPIDFVTKVAMSAWGYGRYGTTYYLPSSITTKNYSTLKSRMVNEYTNILAARGEQFPQIVAKRSTTESMGQANTLEEFMVNLAETFKSPENYYYNHETKIMAIAGQFLGGNSNDATTLDPVRFVNELITVAGILPRHPISTAKTLEVFIDGNGAHAHYPELCLAWLDSLNGDYEYGNPIYRKVYINCPVDVTVYNSSEEIVGQIINGESIEFNDGIYTYIDDDDQKVLVLPSDDAYSVKINATDAGTMTYTATEYDFSKNKTTKVIAYYEIDIESDDQFTGIIENLDSVANAEYPLYYGDELLISSEVLEGDDIKQYTVAISVEGDGSVLGEGTYLSGEYSKMWVVEGIDSFAGWYIDDELISTDLEYRTIVISDLNIVAKFVAEEKTEDPTEDEITSPSEVSKPENSEDDKSSEEIIDSNLNHSPQTGDDNNVNALFLVFVISVLGGYISNALLKKK